MLGPVLNSRLVTAVFKKTVMLTVGNTEVAKLGVIEVPPVQLSVMSPVCSVYPSPRSVGVTDTFEPHINWPPPVCAPANPAKRARTANARIHLRKSTILLLLVKFKLNRSKFSFNLSLKNQVSKTVSANLGNFSVSGGESNSKSRLTNHRVNQPSGLTES
jgi:hypothetical protein